MSRFHTTVPFEAVAFHPYFDLSSLLLSFKMEHHQPLLFIETLLYFILWGIRENKRVIKSEAYEN